MISPRVAFFFSKDSRHSGGNLYNNRACRIQAGDNASVTADVGIGKHAERVSIERNGRALHAECTCDGFELQGECSHVWAALLVADDAGYLQGDGSSGALSLHVASPAGRAKRAREAPVPVPAVSKPAPAPSIPEWRKRLDKVAEKMRYAHPRFEPWPSTRQIFYALAPRASEVAGLLTIHLFSREPRKTGGFSRMKAARVRKDNVDTMPDPADRPILSLLMGGRSSYDYTYEIGDAIRLSRELATLVFPMIMATGRCGIAESAEVEDPRPLGWDAGEPWTFRMEMTSRGQTHQVSGYLARGEEQLAPGDPESILPDFFIHRGTISRYHDRGAIHWLRALRESGNIAVRQNEFDEFVPHLLETPGLPLADLAGSLGMEEVPGEPRPFLLVEKRAQWNRERLEASIFAQYGAVRANIRDWRDVAISRDRKTFVRRDALREQAIIARFEAFGLALRDPSAISGPQVWELPASKLPAITRELLTEGWAVQAEGQVFRRATGWSAEVTSGIDWFGVRGEADFDGVKVRFPELLAAIRAGKKMVQLGDGTFGMLPEEWIANFGILAGTGAAAEGEVRFKKNQVGLLDALLAARPEVHLDEAFVVARDQLMRFEGVRPAEQPGNFRGELRGYQKEGLGWLYFLREFGFGGCLADDMGVGKTPQVLALLESRREARAAGETVPPSLVVVPKSLIFNWKQEAERFTPLLKVLDYTGLLRDPAQIAESDVVITTYGTLRRDISTFLEHEFDYAILDEAQAVKNPNTDASKAVRLIRSSHRLVMTGTPVENHLGDLWSLFEFLNPGMLGTSRVLQGAGALRNPGEETRTILSKALRPFILRRTKRQVAQELPDKIEQTLYCELDTEQRRLYNELRDHYRSQLLKRVNESGLQRSKIQVLEALLRLRQAACHPALVDAAHRETPSAKFDALLPQLIEVAEDHKAIVFSQFTSLLALLRKELDEAKIGYEYLDGQTSDRETPVKRFQNDPDSRIFLISLKAGGVGLNLTAAEYVFLLDPWWNPAVEMQAIDRAHRIGQTRTVFAYRLIAKDTVEEKVLALQQSKRDLADAIISADNSVIRNLSREDLDLLLS